MKCKSNSEIFAHGENESYILVQKKKKNLVHKAVDIAELAECLPGRHKALGSPVPQDQVQRHMLVILVPERQAISAS